MDFVSISNFRDSLAKLLRRADSGYKSCSQDLCNELKNASFDDIFNRHFLIKESGDLRVIKLRIQNSGQALSSAAGYRLIIVCNKKHNHVALLDVYPKRGKYSKMDLSKSEYKDILNAYGRELKSGRLATHDVGKNLEIIDKKSNGKQ
ncbi:MAG: hypothetical protein GXC78_16520 [Chitinophagaceae bacterium]|nr:hypothetical protein [Chitinophagaceae bacterium]